MFALISINKFIVDTPVESTFFKNIFFVPVIGTVVLLWKDTILGNELKAIKLNDVNIDSEEGKMRFNASVLKLTECINLSKYSRNRGGFIDIVCMMLGFSIFKSHNKISRLISLVFICSLVIRYTTHSHNEDLKTKLSQKKPVDWQIKGYSPI